MKGAKDFQDTSSKMVALCPFLIHEDIKTLVIGKKMDRASMILRNQRPWIIRGWAMSIASYIFISSLDWVTTYDHCIYSQILIFKSQHLFYSQFLSTSFLVVFHRYRYLYRYQKKISVSGIGMNFGYRYRYRYEKNPNLSICMK